MEKAAKSRGGGGKLQRSETVTIRLDPKLRYLTDLAARKQRRTVSSFIEWAIESALNKIVLREVYDLSRGETLEKRLGDEAEALWDIDEPDRVAKLGLHYPELLTYHEQVLWKLIKECGYLWKGYEDREGKWHWEVDEDSLIFPRLREHWDKLNQIASGKADKKILPDNDAAPPFDEEDIPF